VVGRALVFLGGLCKAPGLEQDFREQIARARCFGALREGIEHRAIPTSRGGVVFRLFLLLCLRMVVLGEILLRGFQLSSHFGRILHGALAPEGRSERIPLDESLLAFEYQRRKPALLISLDRAHLQRRREPIVRAAFRERLVRERGVLITLLLDIQIAERLVEPVRIERIAPTLQHGIERFRAVEVGEGDRDRTERIVRELAFRPREHLLLSPLTVRDEDAIEQRQERRDALLSLALLEQRPSMFIETL